MPDLPNRLQREEELASGLMLAWRPYRDLDPAEVPWGDVTAAQRRVMVPVLAGTYIDAADQLGDELGVDVDVSAAASGWASAYSSELAAAITAHSITMAATAVSLGAGGSLGLAFGSARAEGIGVSETARAITAGGRDIAGRFNVLTGETIKRTWWTEKDGRVCPICRPLHRTSEDTWIIVIPAGPPAHPRCRCWLEYRTEQAVAA